MSASVTGVTVRIYTKPRCSLCAQARRVLEEIATRVDFVLEVVDIRDHARHLGALPTRGAGGHRRWRGDRAAPGGPGGARVTVAWHERCLGHPQRPIRGSRSLNF